jgi:hypothetical protein
MITTNLHNWIYTTMNLYIGNQPNRQPEEEKEKKEEIK